MPNREQTNLSSEMCIKFKRNFQRITEIYASKIASKGVLILSERIGGENLFDFILTTYRELTREQKEKFFNRLGRLAMLDVVTGNLDRLVQIFTDQGEYTLQDLEANLGNVMVVWSKDKNAPFLYAIDNGIEKDLISSDLHRKKYLSFLQTHFSSRNLERMLAENMVKSIQHALDTQVDDVSTGNVVELKKQFQFFSDELYPLAYPAFLRGLEEMHFHLYENLIPSWESEKASPLKNYLKSNHPRLLAAQQERIDILKNLRRS
ncbi:MAG TPA: hypothetical protein VMR37_07690 [Rhabdochlamydiaceae bacterium]|nr:hypothetical protein [Rhabdochlamydiaceae bacterium]